MNRFDPHYNNQAFVWLVLQRNDYEAKLLQRPPQQPPPSTQPTQRVNTSNNGPVQTSHEQLKRMGPPIPRPLYPATPMLHIPLGTETRHLVKPRASPSFTPQQNGGSGPEIIEIEDSD